MTAAASLIVYAVMYRQQRRLADTAKRLARLLESYEATGNCDERFQNPHLVHCSRVLQCGERECLLYDTPGDRCWQIAALSRRNGTRDAPVLSIQQCHECEVYRRSCPDALTELGESFNNLMFLLEEEDGTAPLTYYWDTGGLSPGNHFVTVNVMSYDDHIGTVTHAVKIRGAR